MATFEVIGTQRVFGVEPGERFSRTLSKVQERRLTSGGHIRRLRNTNNTKADQSNNGTTSP